MTFPLAVPVAFGGNNFTATTHEMAAGDAAEDWEALKLKGNALYTEGAFKEVCGYNAMVAPLCITFTTSH